MSPSDIYNRGTFTDGSEYKNANKSLLPCQNEVRISLDAAMVHASGFSNPPRARVK